MADLISMLPNLDTPLFIVAPDERRQKVFTEVQRPTFKHLPTPMAQVCRFLPFSTLKDQIARAAPFVTHKSLTCWRIGPSIATSCASLTMASATSR